VNSATVPSFWEHYRSLDGDVRAAARKAYELWAERPFHPSLHFKCIHRAEDIWSVRITRGYRAVGTLDGDTVTWFWIGGHDAHERLFS